jgi:hypothetical protein
LAFNTTLPVAGNLPPTSHKVVKKKLMPRLPEAAIPWSTFTPSQIRESRLVARQCETTAEAIVLLALGQYLRRQRRK